MTSFLRLVTAAALCSPLSTLADPPPVQPPSQPPAQVRPEPIDSKSLFPLLVPRGYFDGASHQPSPAQSPGPVLMQLLDGIDVALVIDHPGSTEDAPGLAQYVRDIDLKAQRLDVREAYRIALGNLEAAVKAQRIHVTGLGKKDGGYATLVLLGGDYRSATCLLLPKLLERAREWLGSERILALAPHRNVLALFADEGNERNAKTIATVLANERDEPYKPVSSRLLRLVPADGKPFFEKASVAYADDAAR